MTTPRILVATLCLLILATSASAECAWVMWEWKEDYNVIRSYANTSWTILRSYETLKECKVDQAKLLAGDTSWAPPGKRSRLDDGFFSSFHDEAGKTVRTIQQRALCVPDTVDPRGPKGK